MIIDLALTIVLGLCITALVLAVCYYRTPAIEINYAAGQKIIDVLSRNMRAARAMKRAGTILIVMSICLSIYGVYTQLR